MNSCAKFHSTTVGALGCDTTGGREMEPPWKYTKNTESELSMIKKKKKKKRNKGMKRHFKDIGELSDGDPGRDRTAVAWLGALHQKYSEYRLVTQLLCIYQ